MVSRVSSSRSVISMLNLHRVPPVVFDWLIPLGLLFLFLHQLMVQSFFSFQRFFGLPGDTNQYMWFIGWMWHAIGQGRSPLVTHSFNYPYAINIMDYTSVPALGLLFGWLYGLTGIVFIYNLIVVVNYTLIFIFGKLTLRTLGIGQVLSSVGGLLFCLMPYLTAQELQHLNLAFISPLFIIGYLVARIIHSAKPPGWGIGIFTGLALTLAFYTCLETFVSMALCLALLFVCALLCSFESTRRFTLRLLNVRFLLATAVPLLLVIPGFLNFVQGEGSQSLNFVMYSSFVYLNDLLSAIVPSSVYLAHTSATTALTSKFSGNIFEWDGYLSIPFIACFIVYAVRGWRKPAMRILAYATVCMSVFSLGPVLHVGGMQTSIPLPWALALPFPVIHDLLPARLSLYVGYLGIILVVWGIDEAVKRMPVQLRPLRPRPWQLATLLALGLVVFLWLPLLPTYSAPIPAAANILRNDRVVSRYINDEPTLVLSGQADSFNVVMGILAASNNYDLVTSNVYGYAVPVTLSYKLNVDFTTDRNPEQASEALRQYLPQLRVEKVMFLSTDNNPISATQVAEVSAVLGAPEYNKEGLVMVWAVPIQLRALK